jgi:hypothetical protein
MSKRQTNKLTWPPDWVPDAILPPGVKPVISLDELLDCSPEEYAALVYRRSGRFLGVYASREEADQADEYRYARALLPGGRLPWENEESS